jgi:hypothetical protein
LIYGLCLPLALLLGYLLAEPLESSSLAVVVLVLSVLVTPLLMKWYHPALIISWNSAFCLPFLGAPPLWMGLVVLGLIFMMLSICVDPKRQWFNGKPVAWSLIILGAVILMTALLTGGVGLRVLGSTTYGGRKYVYIAVAIAGYFVLTSQRVPKSRAVIFASLFFLAGATSLIGDFVSRLNGKLSAVSFFVYANAGGPSTGPSVIANGLERYLGLVGMSNAACLFLLSRYGLKGILDLTKPWRLALVILFLAAGLLAGYRSFIGCLILTFAVAFFVEGLHRTRHLFFAVVLGGLCLAGLAAYATRLPLSVQRSLSFLPIEINPVAANSASGSLEWRFEMWKEMAADIPRYMLKGKGYVIDPNELFFSVQNAQQGFDLPAEWAIVAGDYHNGPLSILIPFGVWGALAFGWFLYVSIRLLYRNCIYCDPVLLTINRALFACFVARALFFVFFVGGLHGDLPYFISVVGLAVCLNREPPQAEVPAPDKPGFLRSAFSDI